MSALAWGRLLRLSLAPSAAADALCGLALAADGTLPLESATARIVAASLCVYHGGLALNDWADREHDGRTRPERPLPSGAISPTAALLLAATLLACGVALAWSAAPAAGAWMAGVALLVALYDLSGRGPWLGPTLLALCRAGNLAVGFAYVGDRSTWPLGAALALLYGAYVFTASRLGRMEDGDDTRPLAQRPRAHLLVATGVLLLLPLLPVALASWPAPTRGAWLLACLLLAWSASGVVRPALQTQVWTRPLVERAMGGLLRRLLIFTAAACLLAPAGDAVLEWPLPPGGLPASLLGLLLLLGFPLSVALRRLFPPS